MPLVKGARLGPYEVLAPLGAGGMGEVYRAKDTRLDRIVAIKVLPEHRADTPEARRRFEREARAISSLNHPNICALFDVGQENGVDFLVMEYLEGETLADRLTKGPLTLAQVLKYGMEICDGLEQAHRNGVVHRDLKPGNIMLTKTGAKLMDFGLAKSAAPQREAGGMTALPTLTKPLTAEGSVMGTFQYMAPEQLEGKEADRRSDIFALGAVLYEMTTGRRAFEGQSQASVIAAILGKEPRPLSSAESATPPALEFVVKACLAKDPEERPQTAHDVKLQLGWVAQSSAGTAPAGAAAEPAHRKSKWVKLAWPAAMAVGIVVAVMLTMYVRPTPETPASVAARFTIPLAKGQELAVDATKAVALSADGKTLAYVAAESGVSHLYLRSLGQFDSLLVPESVGATFPFFSPDGQWVAFFSQGKLKKASTTGGSPIVVCELSSFLGGAWLPDGGILLTLPGLGFAAVPAAGGAPQPLGVSGVGKNSPARPMNVPGGRWVLFTNYGPQAADILALDRNTEKVHQVINNALDGGYSEGRLLYYSNGKVWEAPFDLASATVTGPGAAVVANVANQNEVAAFATSYSGVLAYAEGAAQDPGRSLYWVDRKGGMRKIDLPAQDYVDPRVSPDGKRFVIAVRSVTEQVLAVYDESRGVLMKLGAQLNVQSAPNWTPDGKELVFDATGTSGKRGIYEMAADGSSAPQLIKELQASGHVTSISPEGMASVMQFDPVTTTDLSLLSLAGAHELQPFRQIRVTQRQGSFSPEGRWLAYVSSASGRSEVYVEPVGGTRGRWQVSIDGGEQPRWCGNGREIFYRNGTKMFSVAVQTQPTFAAEKPVELFDLDMDRGGAVPGYDVTPDGKMFLMVKSNLPNPTEIRVMMEWPQLVGQGGAGR